MWSIRQWFGRNHLDVGSSISGRNLNPEYMEEGLIAGFNLALVSVGAGVCLGVFTTIIYAGLWFARQ